LARWKKTKARPSRSRRSRSRWFWIAGGVLIAALTGALVAVSALRDEDSEPDVAVEGGPVHVHGLGVNPRGGALYIATHTGMWRLEPGAREPEPVGQSRQDTMGFTVAGPDHFLGSGHPDSLDQPPLLGLIESFDRGATWKPVSLLGEADFHVLRVLGRRVYGYDASHARLMVSGDGGKTWVERSPGTPVLDLAPDPGRPDRLVATTGAGLLTSNDAGITWRRIDRAIGLLAWPIRNRLYLVAANGDVLLSTDAGREWRRVGALGGEPAAFLAHTSRHLYAALHDGRIVRSRDGGRSWRTLSARSDD
jgi:hypothetical protein